MPQVEAVFPCGTNIESLPRLKNFSRRFVAAKKTKLKESTLTDTRLKV
jgi:hypothetical protein